MNGSNRNGTGWGSIFVLLAVFFVSNALAESVHWPWKDPAPECEIGYIRPDAPSHPIAPIEGDRYEDWVPDTPDVAEMSSLAIHALTCATNPLQDHEQYFSVYTGNPLHMAHRADDWCTPKFTEAVALLRTVTGFWADGIPRADGSLFTSETTKGLDAAAARPIIEASGITQFTHTQPVGRIIKILAIYYLRDGNPMWLDMMDKMVNRFDEFAVKKDNYAYFGAFVYEPNAKLNTEDPSITMPIGILGEEINGRFVRACALTYRLTGNSKALELGRRLANYMRFHSQYFSSDGEFADIEHGHQHFHDHTNSLLGILEYARVAGDKDLLNFCKEGFRWAQSAAYGFGTITGFTPERAYADYPSSEGCAVADMIALACNLSAFGVKDYYEEAERWFRNYFSEIQLTKPKADNLVRHFRSLPREEIPYNETDDHVAERNIGSFSGWAGGNEWWVGFQDTDKFLMHCCTGNGARTLFFVWSHILDFKDGQLKVNMLLNRASPWADVYSFIPYQGRVEIKIKQTCSSVLVHAPEWIAMGSSEIQATVDGQPRPFRWEGRYLNLGEGKAGQRIAVTCPISERTVTEKMGRDTYTLLVRGNTVVGIDPPGRICPLFQREYMRDEQPRWRSVRRFAARKPIDY